jgi:hypothetical protein
MLHLSKDSIGSRSLINESFGVIKQLNLATITPQIDQNKIWRQRMLPDNRFMKNDRVEFEMNDRTIHGILVEEGECPKIIADGGRLKFTVPFQRLRFSSKALPKDPPSAIDAWQVSNFTELKEISSETTAFSATITLNGQPAISVTNAGYGAPDRLAPVSGDYGVILDFRASVRQWLSDLGVSEYEIPEEESFWINYRSRLAPYGVLSTQAVAEYLGIPQSDNDDEFQAKNSRAM